MPKFTAVGTEVREQWVRDKFMSNPKLSGPKMGKMLKKEFKASMRTVRIYELRDSVLLTLGWKKNEDGRPIAPTFAEQANRTGEGVHPPNGTPLADPLFNRCVVPVEDVTDAVSFQQKLSFMNDKGFLTPKLKVEAVTDKYVILARER